MIDRIWKIAIAIGITAAVCAILLSIFSGTHLHWSTAEGSGNFDVRIGIGNGFITGFLGSVAIVCLLIGSAFLAASKRPGASGSLSTDHGMNSFLAFLKALTKSRTDRWLGGVCGGLGAHTAVPSWVWRVIFLLMVFCFGTGVIAYLILWICLPEESPPKIGP